jgi:hypothetical protein
MSGELDRGWGVDDEGLPGPAGHLAAAEAAYAGPTPQ